MEHFVNNESISERQEWISNLLETLREAMQDAPVGGGGVCVRSCNGRLYGVFTPEQDNDKTTRQMLNLCIPIMPFTPDMPDLV